MISSKCLQSFTTNGLENGERLQDGVIWISMFNLFLYISSECYEPALRLLILAGLLACLIYCRLPIHYYKTVAKRCDSNGPSLQLRGQLPAFTEFPFNLMQRNLLRNQNRGQFSHRKSIFKLIGFNCFSSTFRGLLLLKNVGIEVTIYF